MRIALYARVSTTEQAIHGLSIDAQLSALREWAGEQSVGEYVDAGISARVPIKKRPELQRLLRDVEQGKIDLIAFVKLDRWTRNIREYYKAQDILDAHNVAWKALHEDYETQTAAGRLKVNIMLAVAQDEADRTSERVKAVLADKRRKGLVVNGHMPLGVDYKDGAISPNADAEKVRELFRLYVATRSKNAVVKKSKEITGKSYSDAGISALLKNEKYEALGIVPPDMWEAAQAIMKAREARASRSGRVYLFSGLMKCPVCGSAMTVRTITSRGNAYVYYRCHKFAKGRRCEWNKSIREDFVEKYLLSHVNKAIEGYNLKVRKKQKKPVDISSLQRKLDRLNELYIEGTILREEYDRRAEPVKALISSAKPGEFVDEARIMSAVSIYPTLSKGAQKAFWSALLREIRPSENGDKFEIVLL